MIMKKQYSSAALEVVRLNNKDIVTISTMNLSFDYQKNEEALSAGRRFDDWDAGY